MKALKSIFKVLKFIIKITAVVLWIIDVFEYAIKTFRELANKKGWQIEGLNDEPETKKEILPEKETK